MDDSFVVTRVFLETLDPAALKKELRRLRNVGDDALMKKEYSAALKAYGTPLSSFSICNYLLAVRLPWFVLR